MEDFLDIFRVDLVDFASSCRVFAGRNELLAVLVLLPSRFDLLLRRSTSEANLLVDVVTSLPCKSHHVTTDEEKGDNEHDRKFPFRCKLACLGGHLHSTLNHE